MNTSVYEWLRAHALVHTSLCGIRLVEYMFMTYIFDTSLRRGAFAHAFVLPHFFSTAIQQSALDNLFGFPYRQILPGTLSLAISVSVFDHHGPFPRELYHSGYSGACNGRRCVDIDQLPAFFQSPLLWIAAHTYLTWQELQLPCLVLDSVFAFALYRLDKHNKKNQELVKQADLVHEQDKREKRAQQLAARMEQKEQGKRVNHLGAGKHPRHVNPTIQQPDKNKKLR